MNRAELRALVKQAEAKGLSNDPRIVAVREYLSAPVTRRCRATGTKVTVLSSEQAGMAEQDEGIHWYTLCETHGAICGHATRKEAESHASSPAWCEKCQEIMNGERPKHLTGDSEGDDLVPPGADS